jgi:hypothetical protein
MPRKILRRRESGKSDEYDDIPFPPPFRRADPTPPRRRMPDGWKPDKPFDYLIVTEDFNVGSCPFRKGGYVRSDNPLANKLLYECPEWVHPVRLAELNAS